MTIADVLTLALDFAYLAVLVVAIGDYRRRREPVGLAVIAVFAAVLGIFAASTVGLLVPALSRVTGLAAFMAFLALPVLTLNLVQHFQPIVDWLLKASVAVAVLLWVGGVVLASGVAPALGTGATLALLLGSLSFFLVLELIAALAFAREAGRRTAASRARLLTAAAATATLAVAALLMLVAGVGSESGGTSSASTIFRALALVAAFGYLVAFQPPTFLHRFGQQATAYEFMRRLNALPTGVASDEIWRLLARVSADSIGACAAAVSLDAAGKGARRIAVGDWPADESGTPTDPKNPPEPTRATLPARWRLLSLPLVMDERRLGEL